MDNLAPVTSDNLAPEGSSAPATSAAPVSAAPVASGSGGWKSTLSADIKNSPLMQKFEDTPEGLNKAFESHANLESLLGHEKVPIPKGIEDIEGWNRFSKAMGIPDKAENYGLADAVLPDSMKGITIDKGKFAEIVHAHKLTPGQAKGLWEAYQSINLDTYSKAVEAHKEQLANTVNQLKSSWGDTYESNVELGQMLINKFSEDQDMNDYITNQLSADPRGIKFLAKIGSQFAENNIGEFKMNRFSLAPEEARAEIDAMKKDLNGPYMNQGDKHSAAEHQAAIDRVNMLQAVIAKSRG